MKKRYIFLLAIIAIFAGVYYFTPSFETIVKKVVHKYGSQVTGTDVNLQGFKLMITTGDGKVEKLTVANPKNYTTPYIFNLGGIDVKVDIKSLTSDIIVIENIAIKKPIITYEMLSLTQNNISEIQNNVAKSTVTKPGNKKADSKKEVKKEETSKSPSKKVIIKKLSIEDGQIEAVSGIKGAQASTTVKLPNIYMQNIGQGKSGEDVTIIIADIMAKVLNTASKTVVDSKISDLKGIAEDNLNNVVGGVKDRIKMQGIFGK